MWKLLIGVFIAAWIIRWLMYYLWDNVLSGKKVTVNAIGSQITVDDTQQKEGFTSARQIPKFPPYGDFSNSDVGAPFCHQQKMCGIPMLRQQWGPYLCGWNKRPFEHYRYNALTPYPYQGDCDHFARSRCQNTCDPLCYKNHFLRCAAGTAMVDPQKDYVPDTPR